MTNEEVIRRLKSWLDKGSDGLAKDRLGYMEGWFREEDAEAFKVAIDTLESKDDRGINIALKLNDEIYIKAFVDEIRKDIVICRNAGGYFGTIPSEIIKVRRGHLYYVQYDGNPNIGNYHCSECRHTVIEDISRKHVHVLDYVYCPYCGAKLKDGLD